MAQSRNENEKNEIPDELPIDLQLDLLVDEELPEDQRRAPLTSFDADPAQWRELSIRFLQRQVEKKSARQLIQKGSLAPCDTSSLPASYKFPRQSRSIFSRFTAIAAGLLIAAVSAMVTIYFVSRDSSTTTPNRNLVVLSQPEFVTTPLPGSIWNSNRDMEVKVPVSDLAPSAPTPVLFPAESSQASLHRTVVIKPDGFNNALVIPVTNLQFQ